MCIFSLGQCYEVIVICQYYEVLSFSSFYPFLDNTIETRERDSSVSKSSASHAGDLGSDPDGGLTRVTPIHE